MRASWVKNTIRLLVDPAKKNSIGLSYVVCDLLEGLAGIRRSEVFCLQDFPKRGLYDVTFHQKSRCRHFFNCLRINKGTPVLEHIRFFPLFGLRERPMIVHLFDPFADIQVVMTYLEQYCDSVRGGERQQNVIGIFNGKYKLWVRLKVEPVCAAGVKHPPAHFSIAGIKGFLVYPGQKRFGKKLPPSMEFKKICHNCGQISQDDGGDPNQCEFCEPVRYRFNGNPRVKKRDEEAVGKNEATMKYGTRLKTVEEHPEETDKVNGVAEVRLMSLRT